MWISNDLAKVKEALDEMADIEKRDWLPPSRAGKLRGKLGYTTSQMVARAGRVGTRVFAECQYFRTYLATAPPRPTPLEKPVEAMSVLFTDGWQMLLDMEDGPSDVAQCCFRSVERWSHRRRSTVGRECATFASVCSGRWRERMPRPTLTSTPRFQ